MLKPKTLEQLIALVEGGDGDATPKAFIAEVDSAEPIEYRKSNFGSGEYSDQKVTFISSKGTKLYAYSKNDEVDFTDLIGVLVVISVPPFDTKAAQIKAKTNGNFTNLNLGSLVEVWDANEEELLNHSQDEEQEEKLNEREWRFTLSGNGEEEEEEVKPKRRSAAKATEPVRSRTASRGKTDIAPAAETKVAKNFSRQNFTLSEIATKYSEAVAMAMPIAEANGITDQQAITAMAATIFINYSHQPGASMELEETPVEAMEPESAEPKEEEVKPKRRSIAKSAEEEEEAPKARSTSPRSSNSSKTSLPARGSRKSTKK